MTFGRDLVQIACSISVNLGCAIGAASDLPQTHRLRVVRERVSQLMWVKTGKANRVPVVLEHLLCGVRRELALLPKPQPRVRRVRVARLDPYVQINVLGRLGPDRQDHLARSLGGYTHHALAEVHIGRFWVFGAVPQPGRHVMRSGRDARFAVRPLCTARKGARGA